MMNDSNRLSEADGTSREHAVDVAYRVICVSAADGAAETSGTHVTDDAGVAEGVKSVKNVVSVDGYDCGDSGDNTESADSADSADEVYGYECADV